MDREEASALWIDVEGVMLARLGGMRPKLKSFEVEHSLAKARQTIIAEYAECDDTEALKSKVLLGVGIRP